MVFVTKNLSRDNAKNQNSAAVVGLSQAIAAENQTRDRDTGMKIGKYKINSSVIIASALALVGAVADLLSSGWVVESIAQMILYFLQQPESFKPYLTDKIYQALLTFLPILSIFLRMYKVRGLPPIEKIENHE